MNIFSIDSNIPLLAETLKKQYKVNKFFGNELTNENLIQTQTNFLIVRSTIKVNKELLKNTKVKFVATATAGFDHIDLEYIKNNNITLSIASGANSNSVAEYVIYSILLWIKYRNKNIHNITAGIIGYGNIGKKVKIYLDSIGIKTLINDPPLEDLNNKHNLFYSLDDIIKYSNIITIHTPMIKEGIYKTLNLIDAEKLYKIKKGSLLINAARGGIVDETTLLNQKNKIDFIIDVWKNEPDYNIELAKNALLATPHIAGHSYEGKLKATLIIVNTLNKLYKLNLDTSIISKELKGFPSLKAKEFNNIENIFQILQDKRQLNKDQEYLLSIAKESNKEQLFSMFRNKYPKRHETLFLKNIK